MICPCNMVNIGFGAVLFSILILFFFTSYISHAILYLLQLYLQKLTCINVDEVYWILKRK